MNKDIIATKSARAADQHLQDAYGLVSSMETTDGKRVVSEENHRLILANLKDCHDWLMALGEF